jgi:hypothetical protein
MTPRTRSTAASALASPPAPSTSLPNSRCRVAQPPASIVEPLADVRTRSPRALVALVAVAALAACGPKLVWHGRSPDRLHDVRVIEKRGQFVVHDGARGPTFDGIAIGALSFSPDSKRLAYAASRGASWRLVVDGREGPPFSAIGAVQWATDSTRVAYIAQRGRAWHVVIDGAIGPAFEAILAGSLTFSDDGRRVAYAGHRADGDHTVVDGTVGPAYRGIRKLQFSRDGRHVGYVARVITDDAVAVVDGVAGSAFAMVTDLTFAPVGDRAAYIAQTREGWHAVVDGAVGPAWDLVRGLAFSGDGLHVAYVARRAQGETRVVVDGVEGPPFTGVRPASLAFGPGASEPTYVAQRDLRFFIVHGGSEGVAFDDVRAPVWSSDGAHWAYVGQLGARQILVLDGVETSRERSFGDVVFAPVGTRLAYAARRGPNVAVVVDGTSHLFDIVLDGTLTFDAAGRHWGCIAGSRAKRRFDVIVDGVATSIVDVNETIDLAIRAAAAGGNTRDGDRLLRAWVTAELARAKR